MSADAASRKAFESWISAPPFEREIERMGEESAWPGSYRPLDVDLAWYAWSAGQAAARERCAQLVAAMDTEGHEGYIETTGDLCEAMAARLRRP